MIGYDVAGNGPFAVIVMNDWLCDTSQWDGARAYLDTTRFTWVFADLRGYGRSRGQRGAFTVEEAAGDVIAVARALGRRSFSVVGHSMSSLVALHLAQHGADRVERAVVVAPPPPAGFGVDDAGLEARHAVALGDDAARLGALRMMWGTRLTDEWIAFKLRKWRETADPEAVAGYVAMFARRGLPDRATRVACPVLAVTGEQDMPIMRRASVAELLAPLCARLTVHPIGDAGHYPMQETPPLLVATIERFLSEV